MKKTHFLIKVSNNCEVAVVFDDKNLNAGPNELKYKLKHTYGKKAQFILQVLNSTGQILFCKELIQP